MELFEEVMFTKEAGKSYRFIGQVFETYWLIQYEDKFLIIDQHAAHEKVLHGGWCGTCGKRRSTGSR
ncbi:MAG: hypothetical protein V8S96_09905 [Lachnospiraceae bacterium]